MTHETVDYIERLRKHGYRVTPQRLIVLDAVCEVGGHADMVKIIERVNFLDPTIDKSTIYRTVDVLCEVGLVIATELDNQSKVYNVAGVQHHHLVCQVCGQVMTIDDDELQMLRQQIFKQYGFSILSEHLALRGICSACQPYQS